MQGYEEGTSLDLCEIAHAARKRWAICRIWSMPVHQHKLENQYSLGRYAGL